MKLLDTGDHVITGEDMYGGSFRLMDKVYRRFGFEFSHVDTTDLDAIKAAIKPSTKMLYLETPTNPMMRITDLRACSDLARQNDIIVVVDNTFMSPYFQRPIELGADIVVHSTTKYINGHSDSVGGVVITTRDDHAERIGFLQNAAGGILSPFDSFLVTRGVKTLAVRMERHNTNGMAIARYLADQPKAQTVNYPGLSSHPQHELAKKQMSGFGGMISFDLGSYENAKKFLDRVRLCSLGESLGGVETLISHPASMTHGSVPEETRSRLGITPGLVRISVGIEDLDDLIADLDNAFAGL
jgi:cystathionine beta-lyase/cystathionine gamma-synthase